MISDIESLAGKAKENITGLFLLLGDAGTLERSHRITPSLARASEHYYTPRSTAITPSPKLPNEKN